MDTLTTWQGCSRERRKERCGMAGPGKRGRKKMPRGNCLTCGTSLVGKMTEAKYCSRACWLIDRNRLHAERSETICKQCGKEFIPKAKDRVMFCSRECAFAYKREHAKPKLEKPSTRYCVICGQELAGRASVACSPECRKELARQLARAANARKRQAAARVCAECGKEFVAEYGDKRRVYCSHKCLTRHNSRIGKHVYKARMRGAERCEAIDPIDVFTRDKWRCYLCGRKTDRRLRGTQSALAPELEHIVPIARGGTNTYDNVACACHDCNRKKRDMLPEEMGEAVSYQKMLAL